MKTFSGDTREILDMLRKNGTAQQAHAKSMPAGFYTSQEIHDLEKDLLFGRQWVCIGRIEEIPRPYDFFTIDLVGEPLLVTRQADQSVRVMSNVCRHRGMPLAEGTGNSRRFICPYHSWAYDSKGKLIVAPLVSERPNFDAKTCHLPTFASEVWQGFLFVNLDGSAPPLAPRLSGLDELIKNYHLDQMTVRYSDDETWPTNWKCLTENFMEGYHLSTVHRKTLHPITPTRLCEHFPAGDGYFGFFSDFPADLPKRGVHHPDISEQEKSRCIMFAIPPGLVAGVTPHNVAFVCMRPDGPGTVIGKQNIGFWDSEISEDDVNDAVSLFLRTMAEDKVQLNNLQRGLQSRFFETTALADTNYEGTILDFYNYLSRFLGAGAQSTPEAETK